MSLKNSNDTIGNQTRDLPACSPVPQPTAPPRGPLKMLTAAYTDTEENWETVNICTCTRLEPDLNFAREPAVLIVFYCSFLSKHSPPPANKTYVGILCRLCRDRFFQRSFQFVVIREGAATRHYTLWATGSHTINRPTCRLDIMSLISVN